MTRQLALFALIGGIQYLLDVAVFHVLVLGGVPAVQATLCSRAVAGLLGFTLNGRWTFGFWQKGQPVYWRTKVVPAFSRFALLWSVQTLLSATMIAALLQPASAEQPIQQTAIKAVVELLIALLSFLAQKYLVYRTR